MADTIVNEPTEVSVKAKISILGLLKDGNVWNLSKIYHNLHSSQNRGRVKKTLDLMKDDKIIQIWDEIEKDVQKQIKKSQPNVDAILKSSENIYKITPRGIEKFNKIQNDCLDDPYLQRIFRIKPADIEF
tara:strand:+ start:108 stop:497 length:390 start_codon:yes stop_codon:yes gene_type:complete